MNEIIKEIMSIYSKSFQYIASPELKNRSQVLLYKELVNIHQNLKSSLIIQPIYTVEDLKVVEDNINLYIDAYKKLNNDIYKDIQKNQMSELLKMKSILYNYLHKAEIRISKLSKI